MAARFQDKVVMVTGASGNVGRALVEHFAAEGARLVLVDRNEERVKALQAELGLSPDEHMSLAADVTDPESVNALVEVAVAQIGRIDVLAHTVGGFAAGTPVHESGLDLWDKMMNLNGRSLFVTAGRVARHMVERGEGGKIVAILAHNALQGTRNAGAYSASKAAAQRIIESMSAELRGQNINVNGIMPKNIDTPQNRQDNPNADFSKWVTPDDIAQTILFLASDESNSINGASLPVYGRA